ncbi:MAG: prepilin-type N-terminal cleavage/methylation domain-containing protein [Proteobacteria bacterium]|nr:prepilin-type N-terminal cleavage/methylation domain-containing protein [Pseudomonadota bacterium]MBU1419789.1 prepilin-type N-terminal cleavage/methylation domain-containing protein [Pseudomonadota bacterium]MBU1456757.1 prepilin-type N-terminal cleavage/methylation domain-containing protein [Pseudomonadota bacterium]
MNLSKRTFSGKATGFTLLEVMIAVAILAISLTSLFGSQSKSVALATETRFNTQAPLLAQMRLTEILSEDESIAGEGDFGENFPGFQWTLSVEDATFGESEILQQLDGELQHLTLTVSWGDGVYSYRLDSFQAKNP